MHVELVSTATTDGHRLDGALCEPISDSQPRIALDAVLLLHGVGGNFYGGNLFAHLVKEFSQAGLAALRVNTRGHDSISISWGSTGPLRQGAAYEVVDHCRYDVNAWLDFLRSRRHQRIAVLGHSLGAIKAIYSQAWQPHASATCVVACSAPRLSYSAFMNSESQPPFFEAMATAREHVQRGQPDTLFQARFPFPILITAAGYLDKYGPEERYNILRFFDRVGVPMLVTYGQKELDSGGVAFAGMTDAIRSGRRQDQTLEVVAVPQADHAYTGCYDQLSNVLLDWLAESFPRKS